MAGQARDGDRRAARRNRATVGWLWRALATALGILLDTFVVRSLLVPALVVLFGRFGSWPGPTVPPVRRFSGSPAAEDLHGTVVHRD